MTVVYVVKDLNNDEVVSIHRTMTGAREALVNFLMKETGYTEDEWKEFADNNGYDDGEDFRDAMRRMDDYDEELMMEVEAAPLED